jgi:putative ABC transport system substrate-binding protein
MKRREFIAGFAGAAAWSAVARAQQAGKVFRLGYLDPGSRTDPVSQDLLNSLMQGLRELGYAEDRNLRMEERFAEGDLDRLPALAAQLARLPLDVIVTSGEAAIRAAMQASGKVPIVMALAPDPVGSGLIASLARPGGNVTGLSALAADLAGKRMEILKKIVPRAVRVAALWNPSNQSKIAEWRSRNGAIATPRL